MEEFQNMKKLLLVLSAFVLVLGLTACGGDEEETPKPVDCALEPEHVDCIPEVTYEPPAFDTVGRIDLMLWSGSGTYFEDLGHQDLAIEDLVAQNDAAAYAVAKAFNELYPNVEINVLAHSGGPQDGGRIWAQELQNYKDAYGQHPTVWATVDLPGDISKGIVADLSMFSDDPVYKSMNPSILNMMNYGGFQGGLPQYILPWGIYVNKELAMLNNLDVPGPDWDIDDYTLFIQNSEDDVFYGSMDTPQRIIETGVNTITKQMFEYDGTGDFVDLNSDEVRALLPYLDEWNDNSVWGAGASEAFMNDHWWWAYKFFMENKLLTLEGDPWMMGDCAHPDDEWWGACKSNDWDIYPRPSTDYVDNTVGIVLDPMAVYNHCLDDGNLSCTDEELLKIQLSYTFSAFWIAETASWEARAAQNFLDVESGLASSSLNDSFPVTTGDLFATQMNIWYSVPKHIRFGATTESGAYKMPGFQEVIRIYEEGQFWDISDKSFPYFYDDAGVRKENLYEWKNYWNEEVNGGVQKGDSNFIDTVIGNLASWNELANARFTESYQDMVDGINTYYPDRQNDEE
jgi:hypothetical protein